MKVLLFRSNNIFASRVQKYLNYYTRENIDYTAVGWDRKCEGLSRENFEFLQYAAGVNVGGLKAMRNHFRWMRFVFNYLKKHSDVTFIHACDLNSAFPAAVYKKFYNKNVKLVFDSCDWFSANFGKNIILKNLFEWMEKFTCKVADELIICEPERKEQITFKLKKEPLVLPNIPEIDPKLLDGDSERYTFSNGWPTLAYFGGLSEERFLKEILTLTKTEKFNLLIAGYGSKSLEDLCEEVSALENVRYFGKVNMKDGLQMSKAADMIYAMYCKINANNIYAAPNKYYEALFLEKPIITTKGTILENKVVNNNIGYVIEEDVEELRQLIDNFDMDDIRVKGENAKKLWKESFSTYVESFFNKEYSKIMK
ncbi:MAG: glycosyltransferase [Bacteroidaceae bacterium]|nr:glycosyltransferase [Bacteroidaceae bacterium]